MKEPRAFGPRLKDLRLASGTKASALAAEMGVSATRLSALENGWARPPAADRIVKAAAFIGADPGELLALAARDREIYVLEAITAEHVLTAEAIISRWRSLSGAQLVKLRALVA